MPRHSVVRMLPYAPEELWAMVGDVDRYPEFVPWITAMRTWNRHGDGEGVEVLDAEATVGFKFLKETFATRVRLNRNDLSVGVSLLHGPFKRLSNRWRFEPHAMGAKVIFDIDFAFRTGLLDAMLAAHFDRAVARLMGCFEARAAVLYTPRAAQRSAGAA
ncbi:MAG: SRPBCC family protein [Caulobacteraceae bacterium]|nr:SRPBCC family protein [Caulobacteraceae bacterium]